ncbi:MAG: hypothetical protein WAV20_00805 [Blastocatellia bacterium]
MKIRLHIERLILDGVRLDQRNRPGLHAAVESELTRLLLAGPLSQDLLAGGAVPSLTGTTVQLMSDVHPAELGSQIARSVFGAISGGPASRGAVGAQQRDGAKTTEV